ncbi:MAG: hypothetical protein ACRDNF_01105, partial [Streptosporangiaceae bacterium]
TQATIDREVARLLREAETTAVDLISSHRTELGKIVDLLLEQETVDGDALYRIAGLPMPEHRPDDLAIAPRAVASTGAGASAPGAARAGAPAGGSDGAGAGSGTAGSGA